jgi:hypothetical protein
MIFIFNNDKKNRFELGIFLNLILIFFYYYDGRCFGVVVGLMSFLG